MKSTTYFAVFEPSETGYGVYFPDLPGCITVGKTIEESKLNAQEVLGLHLWGMEKDNENIPMASIPPFQDEELESGCFIMPITIFMNLVRNEMETKAVKKTLTIPYWLNEIAEKENVNFSKILQYALTEYLQIESDNKNKELTHN